MFTSIDKTSTRWTLLATAMLAAPAVHAAPIAKDTAGTDLSVGAAWVGGNLPTSSDIVTWTGASLNGTQTLGVTGTTDSTSWGGINHNDAATTINLAGTGNTFTLNLDNQGITAATGGLTMQCSSAASTNVFNLNVTGNQTWNTSSSLKIVGGFNTAGTATTASFNFNGATITKLGSSTAELSSANIQNGTFNVDAGTLIMTSVNVSTVVSSNVTVNVASGATNRIHVNTTAIGTTTFNQAINLNGGTQTFTGGTNSYAVAGTITLGASTTSTINMGQGATGVVSLAALAGTGNANFTRTAGGASFTLTGTNNTFTGNTTVASGALNLADNAGLKFMIGANGVNNGISGAGTLTLDGDFTFDLTSAATSGTWQIVNNGTLTETYTTNFTVAGFTDNLDNTWSKSANGTTYTFSESTGALTAVPEPSAALIGGLGVLALLRRRRR